MPRHRPSFRKLLPKADETAEVQKDVSSRAGSTSDAVAEALNAWF